MNLLLFLAIFILFFILTPGVLFFLPPKGNKLVTALVHALIFAVIWTLFTEGIKTDYKEGHKGTDLGKAYPVVLTKAAAADGCDAAADGCGKKKKSTPWLTTHSVIPDGDINVGGGDGFGATREGYFSGAGDTLGAVEDTQVQPLYLKGA